MASTPFTFIAHFRAKPGSEEALQQAIFTLPHWPAVPA